MITQDLHRKILLKMPAILNFTSAINHVYLKSEFS